MSDAIERFLAFARRELDAEEVTLLERDGHPPEDAAHIGCTLADGRRLVVRFSYDVENRDALARRLEMLASTFPTALDDDGAGPRRKARPSISNALHEELLALADRAKARDALVVDAHAPVVWGTAHGAAAPASIEAGTPSARAIDAVRALPAIPMLRKGRHLHELLRGDDFGYLARSFGGIYVLVAVYDAPFDELGAERAMNEALPRVERLVLALPPLEPTPEPRAGVVAMRPRRRR